MKTVVALAFLSIAAVAQAQPAAPPAQVTRADAWGSFGWYNGNKSDVADRYNGWYNRTLWGGVGASYYWTDHWRTDVEFGAHTEGFVRGQVQVSPPVPNTGYVPYVYTEHRYVDRTLAIGQSYQLLRNAWVHPFVGAGIDLDWERHSFLTPRQSIFTRPPDQTEIQLVPASSGVEEEFKPKAFVVSGIKAYFSERAFFRTDLKVAGAKGVDHVVVRVGFGLDFSRRYSPTETRRSQHVVMW